MKVRLLLVVCVALVCASGCSAMELYVAPGGSDANPGTLGRPFATLERARESIRELKQKGGMPAGKVTVYLRGGTYYLAQSLEFDARDSGSQAAPITYRAYGKEKAWLSGGKSLDAGLWKPVTDPAVRKRIDPRAGRGAAG